MASRACAANPRASLRLDGALPVCAAELATALAGSARRAASHAARRSTASRAAPPISLNWLVFIWAVNVDRVLETSLGYFMTPLVNVLFGAVFLRERLSSFQLASVLLATAAVLNLTLRLWPFPVDRGRALRFVWILRPAPQTLRHGRHSWSVHRDDPAGAGRRSCICSCSNYTARSSSARRIGPLHSPAELPASSPVCRSSGSAMLRGICA